MRSSVLHFTGFEIEHSWCDCLFDGGRVDHLHRSVAEDAVFVAVGGDLLTEALLMEDVSVNTRKPDYVTANPDARQTDPAVEEFTLLEEKGSVGHAAHLNGYPGVVAGVPRQVPDHKHCHEHHCQVGKADHQEKM